MSSIPTKQPRRPGRSSRRRKRKAQSILDAATSLVEKDADASVPAVPPDRGITLEGVRVRRRECRQRLAAVSNSTEDVQQEEDLLDSSDEQKLTSQLGFVPGNVVCVAARLTSEFDITKSSAEQQQQMNVPSVVKLYPMVVRDSYHGGKSDGRQFKGRRRGGMRMDDNKSKTTSGDSNPETSTIENAISCSNDVDSNANINKSAYTQCTKQSKERYWFINDNKQDIMKQQIIEPFPTLYWLTSPLLRSQISKIELSKTHGVQSMEQKLRSSQQYLEQMERAHKSYGKARWELLTDDDREEVLKRGWGEALGVGRGVAGIRPKKTKHASGDAIETWDGVKCLHAHAAHYLAQLEEWREERLSSHDDCKRNNLEGLIESFDRDDLNLVGKWTVEAVLESIQKQV